tara:strand:- start:728 stop:862 length:135 start_codon:yes stop_codon:yes gene_type:complete
MEILLWIIFAALISKFLLKALFPYANKNLEDKLKEYWEDLKNYF